MLCQECGQHQATVHIKRSIGDHVEELHLCSACAQDKGEFFVADPAMVLQNFLAGLAQAGAQAGPMPAASQLVCPECGFDYATFQRTGRLGCPACYGHFAAQLGPLLKRLHGNTRHVGKVPQRRGGDLLKQRQRETLRHKLDALVAQERYEEAAKVRDEIRALDAAHGEGGGDDVSSGAS